MLLRLSEQCTKSLHCEPCILYDSPHSIRVDWVVARDSQYANPIGHNDMLSLPCDAEARLFQPSYRVEMVDTRDLWHT